MRARTALTCMHIDESCVAVSFCSRARGQSSASSHGVSSGQCGLDTAQRMHGSLQLCFFFFFSSSCFRVHQVGGVQTTEYSVRATIVLQDRMFFVSIVRHVAGCEVHAVAVSPTRLVCRRVRACRMHACFNCLYPCKSQTLREFLLVFYYTHGRACTHSYIHIYIRLLLKISFTYYRNYYTRIHTQLYISNGNNETLNEMYSGNCTWFLAW